MAELAPLFGSSAPDEGRWALWSRERDGQWVRWLRYSDDFNWLRAWLLRLAEEDPVVDWTLMAGPGMQETVVVIPAVKS